MSTGVTGETAESAALEVADQSTVPEEAAADVSEPSATVHEPNVEGESDLLQSPETEASAALANATGPAVEDGAEATEGGEQRELWEVIACGNDPRGLTVRQGRELTSEKLQDCLAVGAVVTQLEFDGRRLRYQLLRGSGPEDGWITVRISGEDVAVRLGAESLRSRGLKVSPDSLLHTDTVGRLRGRCQNCKSCKNFVRPGFAKVMWNTAGMTSIDQLQPAYDRRKQVQRAPQLGGSSCKRCGCPCRAHVDLTRWLGDVQRASKPFRTRLNDKGVMQRGWVSNATAETRSVPAEAHIPRYVLDWQPVEVALYLLSFAHFDPRRDGRKPTSSSMQGTLVSVLTPTSEKRQPFHPLLYECFARQTHEPKELVIIDTGTRPSAFLQARAREDSRVIYRFFPHVADLRDVWLSMQSGQEKRKSKDSEKDSNCWSLGLKRNIACHLARGSVFAHFDDDDVYQPNYLSHMLAQLLKALEQESEGSNRSSRSTGEKLPAALVTMSQWHMVNVHDTAFGFFDPMTEKLLQSSERKSYQYGYGFTYVYTRAAWELVPFPDVEFAEDGEFTTRLDLLKVPIKLVKGSGVNFDGLAAHTYHPDTTSAGEFADNVRMGTAVPTPAVFKTLMPVFKKVTSALQIGKGALHPARTKLQRAQSNGEALSEIGWEQKQDYLQEHPEVEAKRRPPADEPRVPLLELPRAVAPKALPKQAAPGSLPKFRFSDEIERQPALLAGKEWWW
mmetsp:Transcript_54882/g.98555  ORF Transcript_54882/g.98555 Transcript_54882/m.98555 type:complete len:731 (-) Transcript_54882:57-2249(-)